MANLTRVFLDHECTTAPLAFAKIRALDENTKKLLNGDEGGSWSPSSPIVIGGAGLRILGRGAITGPGLAGALGVIASPSAPVRHGRLEADDYIWFTEVRTYTVSALVMAAAGDHALVMQNVSVGGAETRAHSSRWLSSLRVHDGATLSKVRCAWIVTENHSNVPEARPKMRVVRVSATGQPEPLRFGADTDSEGFIFMGSAASASAYNASNDPQVAEYEINVSQRATIDTSRFRYYAEFIEESGAGAFTEGTSNGNHYYALTAVHTNVRHMGPQ